MAWTSRRIVIALVMIITGSVNTLTTKWADLTFSSGISGKLHEFRHPLIQACGMFLGEILCFFAYFTIKKYRRHYRNYDIYNDLNSLSDDHQSQTNQFSPLIFLPPALFDIIATSLMYFAIIFTYASSFQMLRGAVIMFTGVISVIFLHNKLSINKWLGIFVIVLGLVIVGLADFMQGGSSEQYDKNSIITGDLLIIIAQIFVAFQVCYEQKYVNKYDINPLLVVGWEGIFGFTILGTIIFILNFVPVSSNSTFYPPLPGARLVVEDIRDALYQIKNSPILFIAILGNVLSIAVFNFTGISITKEINATTRMVLDTFRTLIIWLFSLAVFWQKFHYLQLIGFLILLTGMVVYEKLYAKCFNQNIDEIDENSTLIRSSDVL